MNEPTPRSAALVVNTKSRKGQAAFDDACRLLKERGIALVSADAVKQPEKLPDARICIDHLPSGTEIRIRSSSTMKRLRAGLAPGRSDTGNGRRLSSSVAASSLSATVRANWDSGARYVAGSRACRSTNSSGQLP